MNYRAQFAFELPPEGWIDEDFEYVFDASNTPGLGTALSSGQTLLNVPLQFEPGNEYRVRSVDFIDPIGTYGVRFRDADGVLLMAEFAPSAVFFRSGASVPVDWQIPARPGSLMTVDLVNLS